MNKFKNPYGDCQIMDLNLVGVSDYSRLKLSGAVALTLMAPLGLIGLAVMAVFMPEFGFLAECQNVPGGDICSISFK
ncbi:MAG: hypothetical protein H6855_07805 [Rhodospirillales bacterium]|nr:hypothetical protein [Rhodospirillales bacterium]MCB9973507.1 hypothetical protein [Rhodospirillales bacterium]